MSEKDQYGRVELICGCMFSGKTTELIRRLGEARSRGLAVIAVSPRRDTRSGPGRVATHDGRAMPAAAIDAAADLSRLGADADVVGVDEAHFLGAAAVGPVLALSAAGKEVIAAGVYFDHRGEPFEPFVSLMGAAADAVTTYCGCAVCGRPAMHSYRKADAGDRIVVGGAEMYEARCEGCFRTRAASR